MKSNIKDEQNIAVYSKTPKLDQLKAEIQEMNTNAAFYHARTGHFYDTRYCLWSGQSPDGRKWDTDENGDIFPWEGASDTRVRLADKIIKERKRLRKLAFWGKRIVARALGSQNQDWAATVNPLLRWMLYTHGLDMINRELSLVWSYMDTLGAAVLGVFWQRETRLGDKEFDLGQLQQAAQETGDPNLMAMLETLTDPSRDEENIAMVQGFAPEVTGSEARAFLKDLRKLGTAKLKVPYIFKNEPRLMALRPFVDVLFDPALDNLQDGRLIVYREFIGETELKERAVSRGYSEKFITEALKHKGSTSFEIIDPLYSSQNSPRFRRTLLEDTKHLIELQHCYYRVSERGSTSIYCTVIHHDVKELYATHEPVEYDHGGMPFHSFTCEREERPIMESRGIPEIVSTWQTEKKIQRDARVDRTSIEVVPMMVVPKGMAGQVEVGPAQQVEQSRKGEYSFLQPPALGSTTKVVENDVDTEINEYFGRFSAQADPAMTMAARQELVTDTLNDLCAPIRQVFQLAQQYFTDEDVSKVVGHMKHPFHVGREEIQGMFDLEFTFDVRTMDIEFIQTIGGVMKDVIIPLDRQGTLDMTGLVRVLLQGIDPNIAETVQQQNTQVAQMQEVNDQQDRLAKIAVGIEPPQKPFSNPQLRLGVLQNVFQNNPGWQQRIQSDELFAKLMTKEVKMLRFSQAQSVTNPMIGRTGAKPVMGGDGSGMPAGDMGGMAQLGMGGMGQ